MANADSCCETAQGRYRFSPAFQLSTTVTGTELAPIGSRRASVERRRGSAYGTASLRSHKNRKGVAVDPVHTEIIRANTSSDLKVDLDDAVHKARRCA